MRFARLFLILGAIALVLLAACNNDGDSDATPDDSSAPQAEDTGDADDTMDDAASGAFDQFSAFSGSWTGAWFNDTFGSTAQITMTIAINDDGTGSFSFDLPSGDTGAPFGLPSVDTKTFAGSYDETGLIIDAQGDDLFGDFTVTITPEGRLTAEATMDGAPGIDSLRVEGTINGSEINITYTIVFPGGSDATGSATLTK